jgi:hypothetical protein
VPAALQRVGRYAFAFSGLRSFDAGSSAAAFDEGAFRGCAVLETATFGVANWGKWLFCGCTLLKLVGVSGIGKVDKRALMGSSVEEVFSSNGMALGGSDLAKAIAHVSPPIVVVVTGEWMETEPRTATPLVRLKVRRAALLPTGGHRKWLASIDLSGLEGLPSGWTLHDCPFLQSVLLPGNLLEVPVKFFRGCLTLVSVNLHECSVLQRIGEYAFEDCVKLRRVELPASVRSVDFRLSGIEDLDVRGAVAESAWVGNCANLRRLVLGSGHERGNWDLCPSLRRVTFGRLCYDSTDEDCASVLGEVRFLAPCCPTEIYPPGLLACLSRAVVLAELGALAGQPGRPLLAL